MRHAVGRLCVHLAIWLLVMAGRVTGRASLVSTARFLRL
jgi:hypothetical protein